MQYQQRKCSREVDFCPGWDWGLVPVTSEKSVQLNQYVHKTKGENRTKIVRVYPFVFTVEVPCKEVRTPMNSITFNEERDVEASYGYCNEYQPHAVKRMFDYKNGMLYDMRWDEAGNLGQVSMAKPGGMFQAGRFLYWTEDSRMHAAVDDRYYSYYAYDHSGERRLKLTGKNDLLDVANAVKLSKAVIKNIKQNLFWALFYNSVGIPIAAGVLYPAFGIKLSPMIGSAAMSLSSVTVVTNALRLSRLKLQKSGKKSLISADNSPQSVENCPCILEKIIKEQEEEPQMVKTMQVIGMMCKHCVAHVSKALNDLPGVTAEVDLNQGRALITTDGAVSDEQMIEAVKEAGYEATMLN